MEPPMGWKFNKNFEYVCMCGTFKTYSMKDCSIHMINEIGNGFCSNGIRCNSLTDYECVCGKKGMKSNYEAFMHHLREWNCMSQKLLSKNSFCHTCNRNMKSVAALQRHQKTPRHIEREQSAVEIPTSLKCKVCDIKCNGQKAMIAHLATKKHKQREQGGVPESLFCKTCDIKCRGQKEMIAHLETKKHMKKMETSKQSNTCE